MNSKRKKFKQNNQNAKGKVTLPTVPYARFHDIRQNMMKKNKNKYEK